MRSSVWPPASASATRTASSMSVIASTMRSRRFVTCPMPAITGVLELAMYLTA
jgi:hypothetical protein